MDIQDLLADAKNLTTHELEQRLSKLCRDNYRYKNLDEKNRKIVLELLKKNLSYLRQGYSISSTMVRDQMYDLHRKQKDLDLTEEDLKDIREILDELRQ